MRSVRALARLTGTERAAAARAFFVLPVVAIGLRLRGLNRVQARLVARCHRPAAATTIDPHRLGHIVNRVASLWRANCLTRSLVTLWLMDRAGQLGELRIGVRSAAAELEFHAWVETDGQVANDRADIATEFTPFAEPIRHGSRFV